MVEDDERRVSARAGWRVLDVLALAGLGLLILLAFWHIGPAGRVVAGGDLFAYFYPYWSGAAEALRAGRLPLWNPHLFMGVPFLANSQVGVLYPFNWPLWLLLPAHQALHWSIISHLCLAAAGAYVYARASLRLGRLGAWTAGAILALGGYLGAQVEHVNQLQTLAWLPWLLVLFEWAVLRRHRLAFVGLAAAVAMTLLAGHTQSAFIALTGLAACGVGPAVWSALRGRGWRPAGRRAAVLAVAVALAALVAAGQLLPTAELVRHSVRSGGLPFSERVSFSLSPVYLARALLPGYGRVVEPENLEYVATAGVAGLVLASIAGGLALAGRDGTRRGRGQGEVGLARCAWLAMTGLFLSLGLYNPLYLLLARFVPGFMHFRAPARWLAWWVFGAAMLAGSGVDRLPVVAARLPRRVWAGVGVALAGTLVWGALGGRADPVTVAGWLAGTALLAALLWLGQRSRPGGSLCWHLARMGLSALVVVELLASARTLPHARATGPEAYTSLRPAAAHLLAATAGSEPAERFLSVSGLFFDPGDLAELRLIYGPQLSPDALYDLIVAAKHREVLSPNLSLAFGVPAVDGYDGGVLPLARYVALQRAFLPSDQVSLDGRLRENLAGVPDGRWLSLFNVGYVITDKVLDAWIDDVFYDLQFDASLSAGQQAAVASVPSFEATALGLVSYLDGAAMLDDGTPVGEVVIGFTHGATRTYTLRAGAETAEGVYGTDVEHGRALVGGHFWPGRPEGTDYATRLRWETPATLVRVAVRATLPEGRLVVRGISLVDERTGSFQSLVISDRGHFQLVHSGDVKVYQNLDVLPRAFVVRLAWPVDDWEQALARMQEAGFDPASEVVLEGAVQPPCVPVGTGPPAVPDDMRMVSYAPERVVMDVELAAPGYLVLTDANYPGWRAWVNGDEATVMTADLLFRAVCLAEGQHHVEFVFDAPLARAGLALSLAGTVGLTGLAVACVYNRSLLAGPGRRGRS
jgi:hypothetical protein